MNTSIPFAIVSADKDGLNEVGTEHRRTWFEHKLVQLGYSFRKVAGVYKGKPETSYLVLIEDENQYPALFRLAHAFEQESVLTVDANGYAALFDADGNQLRELGKWHEITADLAHELDAYTQVGGRYYAAIGTATKPKAKEFKPTVTDWSGYWPNLHEV